MNSNYFKIVMRLLKIAYGKNLLLKGCPIIYNKGGARIVIGNDVTIKSSALSNLVGLYSRTIICARCEGAEIVIGNKVGISGATIYARTGIYIGDNTQIGGNAKILDNDFHPLDAQARSADIKEAILSRPIRIGKDCFIGCNSIILKGTELGNGCIVGAGSVVSGKFEAGSVIVGNPAKTIRKM